MLNMTAEHHANKWKEAGDSLRRQMEDHWRRGEIDVYLETRDMLIATNHMGYENQKELEAYEKKMKEIENMKGAYI